MTASPQNKSYLRIPLRIVLVVPFLILIVLATGLVSYLSYRNEQKAIWALVHQLRSDIDARIQNHLRSFLEIPPRINQLNANAIRRGWLKADEPDVLERHFLEQLQVYDSVTSIYFGNSKGGLVDAGREGMKGSQYIMVTNKFVKGPLHKYATDNQNNRVEPLMNIPFFDATVRPWYTGAVKKGDNYWSDIYTLVTGQDMAIAASCPVYDKQRNLLGVVSVDIFLSQLSGFLKTLNIGKTGISFIMEHSGLLVASSTDEKLLIETSGAGKNKRLDSKASSIPLVRHSVEAIAKKFDNYQAINEAQSFDVEIDDNRYFLTVSPFQTNIGLHWLIVTVMPESDFMAQIKIDNRNTALLIGAILIIVIILCIITAQFITKPIIDLNIAAQSLAKGNWDEINAVQRLKETGDLTLSFNHMVRQLKQIMGELKSEIEERKKMEEALIISEENYRSLIENQTELICRFEPDGTFIFVNDVYCQFFGKTKDELIGKKWFPLPIDEDLNDIQEKLLTLSPTNPIVIIENRLLSSKGKIHWIQFINKGSFDLHGNLLEIHSVGRDITERKHAEEALKKQLDLFARITETSPVGITLVDSDGSISFANIAAEKILGLTRDKITGRVYNDPRWHIVDEYGKPFPDNKLPFFIVMKTGAAIYNVRHGIKWPDGRSVILSINAAPLKDNSGKVIGMVAALQDITERKRMEEELLKADKLESVGILAGGIAHDFNNILTSITGNISMAKMQVESGNKIFGLLSSAETASIRAQSLTRQLLTFAKGGTPVKEIVFFRKLIKESSLFALRGSKSGCEFHIAEDLWPVEADPGQISQVISNIVINADQAMSEEGTIRITAENLMPEKMHEIPVEPGRYIRISITDHGVGIAEKHISKIFDPYFTTKHAGSGLGLATAFSIIKKHNGHISVDSLPGAGTTFHIYLPASDKEIRLKEEKVLLTGQGKILMMDDDELLKELAKEMLDMLGYESAFAKDGAEAVDIYRKAIESQKPFDAVILDLTIPGSMGGKEVIKILLEIDPEVRAIVFSGYSESKVLSNFREYGFKGMMPKPFDSYVLGKVLKEVLTSGKSMKET